MILEAGMFLIPFLCGDNNKNCTEFSSFDMITFVHGKMINYY